MHTVLISGVFDPLHAGHLAYIQRARAYSTNVIAHVSDAPDKHPPLVPLEHRRTILQALGCITTVSDIPVASAIRIFRPLAFLKGSEWRDKLPQDIVDACTATGTPIEYCDTRRNSSSALLADYERARNAEKLAALESFVQQQTPADKPWAPVTDYSRETRRAIEAPNADAIAEVFAGCTVLDYGCGLGHLVELLKERDMDVTGWDPHYRPGDYLRWSDVVICREVLEHLTVPELRHAVSDIVEHAKKYIYITTRFTAKSHLLDVDGSDDLDPTHITMLNQDLLRTLFVLEGCTRRADLEAKLDHQKKGRVLVYEVPRD